MLPLLAYNPSVSVFADVEQVYKNNIIWRKHQVILEGWAGCDWKPLSCSTGMPGLKACTHWLTPIPSPASVDNT